VRKNLAFASRRPSAVEGWTIRTTHGRGSTWVSEGHLVHLRSPTELEWLEEGRFDAAGREFNDLLIEVEALNLMEEVLVLVNISPSHDSFSVELVAHYSKSAHHSGEAVFQFLVVGLDLLNMGEQGHLLLLSFVEFLLQDPGLLLALLDDLVQARLGAHELLHLEVDSFDVEGERSVGLQLLRQLVFQLGHFFHFDSSLVVDLADLYVQVLVLVSEILQLRFGLLQLSIVPQQSVATEVGGVHVGLSTARRGHVH